MIKISSQFCPCAKCLKITHQCPIYIIIPMVKLCKLVYVLHAISKLRHTNYIELSKLRAKARRSAV